MSKREQNYNIGLDIGTGSVGWAVTDDNYNLLNIKKQNLWGSRLFKTAETAEKTRGFRSMRRRYRRRRNRLNWLNEIFADYLAEVDPTFLLRLKHSWVSKKDTNRKRDPYNLFIDENYNDQDFYNEYPTIFHLRKKLIESHDKQDIRLIYLAIHNILKYRGNFTYENQKFDIDKMNDDLSIQIKEFFEALGDYDIELPENLNYEPLTKVLLDDNLSPSYKVSDALKMLNPDKSQKQQIKNALNLFVGNKADLIKIFNLELDDKLAVNFSSRNIENELPTVLENLDEKQQSLVDQANTIFSSIMLKSFLGDERYICNAKVKSYDDHKQDLINLKQMWNETEDRDKVKACKAAYGKYIDNGNTEDLYKALNTFLKTASPESLVNDAVEKITKHTYLLKQRSRDNTVIPYQINENELIAIINNQAPYYPFLQ